MTVTHNALYICTVYVGNDQAALNDLSNLLKLNKSHADAYLSKAVLLAKRKEMANAVFHFSQAIALKPSDPDLYFMRAELYEKVRVQSTECSQSTVS